MSISTENFVANSLTALGAVDQNSGGKFYLDGTAVNVELSQVIAETMYIKQIFRDGQAVTGKYAQGLRANGTVRVLLDTPLPFSSRTVEFGGGKGTTGNGGVFNTNGAILPASTDFFIKLNQVNDQMMIFPELSKEYLPLDVMSKKIAQYGDRVQMDRDASTLAEIIAYNVWRSLNGADNLNRIDLTKDYAINELLTSLNTKLDNGDLASGVYSFPQEGRAFIGRPTIVNKFFGNKQGIILMGGNLAQEMLVGYDLNKSMNERKYVGTNFKGNVMQFDVISAPDYIWSLAEQYLGLEADSLKNVSAIACSYEATALANNVDLGVKIIDAQTPRGSLAQPINIWGHEAFRKSQLIGDATLTNDYLVGIGFADNERKTPIAPQQANNNSFNVITVPVYNDIGEIVGFREVAKAPKPNGGGFVKNPDQVATPVIDATTASAVTITTVTANARIYYTTNGREPTVSSKKYTAPFSATSGTVIKAIAVADDMATSGVATATAE